MMSPKIHSTEERTLLMDSIMPLKHKQHTKQV